MLSRKTAVDSVIHDIVTHASDPQSMFEHPDETQILDDSIHQPQQATHVFRVFPSADEPTLTIIDGTLFDWKTVPALESQGLMIDVERREWQDGKPAQVFDSVSVHHILA
jgi:hypothetical protein